MTAPTVVNLRGSETSGARPWLSVHLHFEGALYGPHCDSVIRDVVEPIVTSCRSGGLTGMFFFIRYGADGPHVRLRLLPASETAKENVIVAVEQSIAGFGSTMKVQQRWSQYEPELERYGGPHAMEEIERSFEASSTLALLEVQDTRISDRNKRLGTALLAMTTLLYEWLHSAEAVEALATHYWRDFVTHRSEQLGLTGPLEERFDASWEKQSEVLQPMFDAAWHTLSNDASLPQGLAAYRQAMRQTCDQLKQKAEHGLTRAFGRQAASWKETAFFISPSLLHMTNNRLGVTLAEEAFLAYVLYRACRAAPRA